MPGGFVLTLPETPPSVNSLFANVGRRRVKTRAYLAWRRAAEWELASQYRGQEIIGRVSVSIQLPMKTRGDADNRVKATLDALQGAGIIVNDSQCDPVSIGRAEVEQTTIHIEVAPC